MNVRAALIIGAAIIVAVVLWIYFSPYQTWHGDRADNPRSAEFRCAVALSGGIRR